MFVKNYPRIACFYLVCCLCHILCKQRKVALTYPVELLAPIVGAHFSGVASQDKLSCFSNRDYQSSYLNSLKCFFQITDTIHPYCNNIWGSRSVVIEVNGSIEFMKFARLPPEQSSYNEEIPTTATKWLELASTITLLNSSYFLEPVRDIKVIACEPIFLCARSNDWSGRDSSFQITFRAGYIRQKDKEVFYHRLILHFVLMVVMSSVWLLPYIVSVIVGMMVFTRAIKHIVIIGLFSGFIVLLTPIMLTKGNRHVAIHYIKYFFTRIHADETREIIKKRIVVFQALYFSSALVCIGVIGSYIFNVYFGVDRDMRNFCIKLFVSMASSWLTFSVCRSFERFCSDWSWLGLCIGLSQLLEKHLNPMCHGEIFVLVLSLTLVLKVTLGSYLNKIDSIWFPYANQHFVSSSKKLFRSVHSVIKKQSKFGNIFNALRPKRSTSYSGSDGSLINDQTNHRKATTLLNDQNGELNHHDAVDSSMNCLRSGPSQSLLQNQRSRSVDGSFSSPETIATLSVSFATETEVKERISDSDTIGYDFEKLCSDNDLNSPTNTQTVSDNDRLSEQSDDIVDNSSEDDIADESLLDDGSGPIEQLFDTGLSAEGLFPFKEFDTNEELLQEELDLSLDSPDQTIPFPRYHLGRLLIDGDEFERISFTSFNSELINIMRSAVEDCSNPFMTMVPSPLLDCRGTLLLDCTSVQWCHKVCGVLSNLETEKLLHKTVRRIVANMIQKLGMKSNDIVEVMNNLHWSFRRNSSGSTALIVLILMQSESFCDRRELYFLCRQCLNEIFSLLLKRLDDEKDGIESYSISMLNDENVEGNFTAYYTLTEKQNQRVVNETSTKACMFSLDHQFALLLCPTIINEIVQGYLISHGYQFALISCDKIRITLRLPRIEKESKEVGKSSSATVEIVLPSIVPSNCYHRDSITELNKVIACLLLAYSLKELIIE